MELWSVQIQPFKVLQPRPAAGASQSQALDAQLDRGPEHWQIAYPTQRAVVDRRNELTAAAAAAGFARGRPQLQHQPTMPSTLLVPPVLNPIPLPAAQLGNTMTLGHGRPQFVALDISKSARSAVRLSPQLGEEPYLRA